VIAIAGQEAQPLRGVGEREAERVAVAVVSGVAVAGIDVNVAELARAVGPVAGVGVILDAADDRDVAAFRVLEAEAVVAVASTVAPVSASSTTRISAGRAIRRRVRI